MVTLYGVTFSGTDNLRPDHYGCLHDGEFVLRFVKSDLIGKMFYLECAQCGWLVKSLKKTEIAALGEWITEAIPERDYKEFRSPYLDKIHAAEKEKFLQQRRDSKENDRQLEKRSNEREWWDWYKEYLQSPAWQEKRQLVFKRANGICEGCGKNKATQVHHLTYSRVGHEMLFDLVAICKPCHDSIPNTFSGGE